MKITKRSIFILVVIVATIAVDQISKILVRINIQPRTDINLGERISLIGDMFIMMNVENAGLFLLILPILVLGFVLHYVFKEKSLDNWSLFAFASIIGGGVANVYDRIVYGSVTDFFFIDLGGVFRTGIFNMADLSVTTGMIILLLVSFKKKQENDNIEKTV